MAYFVLVELFEEFLDSQLLLLLFSLDEF